MIVTFAQVRKLAGRNGKKELIRGFIDAMNEFGKDFRMDEPQQLAAFLAQITHESAHFDTWEEYASGKAYEGRKDLGNVFKGDGVKYKGHGPLQFTGRFNHQWFTDWCKKHGYDAPDFIKHPKELASSRWGTLAALAYWRDRRKDIPYYADRCNQKMITKLINGGYNGLADRIRLYDRAALILLGYGFGKSEIQKYQKSHGLEPDGKIGTITRAALHIDMKAGLSSIAISNNSIELPIEKEPYSRPAPDNKTDWITVIVKIIMSIFGRR